MYIQALIVLSTSIPDVSLQLSATMQFELEKPAVSGISEGRTSSSEEEFIRAETHSGVTEEKLMRKCDIHVVLPVTVLFVLSFLDRINIGNARIQGLEKDLHMKGNDYNVALLVFFIPYILLEVPSNYLIRKVAPSTWLSGLMVCWGNFFFLFKKNFIYQAHSLILADEFFRCHYYVHGSYSELCQSCGMPISSRNF